MSHMHIPPYNMNMPQPCTNNSKIWTVRTMSYTELDIRVLLTQPSNQDIPYPSTKLTIPSMPQAYTISWPKVNIKTSIQPYQYLCSWPETMRCWPMDFLHTFRDLVPTSTQTFISFSQINEFLFYSPRISALSSTTARVHPHPVDLQLAGTS